MANPESITITLNGNVEEEIAFVPEMQTICLKVANEIADIARTTAPVVSSGYVDGITVQKTEHYARVLATADDSAFVEFGVPSQGQAAHFTLRRAVDAAGYKFGKK